MRSFLRELCPDARLQTPLSLTKLMKNLFKTAASAALALAALSGRQG
jgi:hypothetical protein